MFPRKATFFRKIPGRNLLRGIQSRRGARVAVAPICSRLPPRRTPARTDIAQPRGGEKISPSSWSLILPFSLRIKLLNIIILLSVVPPKNGSLGLLYAILIHILGDQRSAQISETRPSAQSLQDRCSGSGAEQRCSNGDTNSCDSKSALPFTTGVCTPVTPRACVCAMSFTTSIPPPACGPLHAGSDIRLTGAASLLLTYFYSLVLNVLSRRNSSAAFRLHRLLVVRVKAFDGATPLMLPVVSEFGLLLIIKGRSDLHFSVEVLTSASSRKKPVAIEIC
jgi:hypothetical protein